MYARLRLEAKEKGTLVEAWWKGALHCTVHSSS